MNWPGKKLACKVSLQNFGGTSLEYKTKAERSSYFDADALIALVESNPLQSIRQLAKDGEILGTSTLRNA